MELLSSPQRVGASVTRYLLVQSKQQLHQVTQPVAHQHNGLGPELQVLVYLVHLKPTKNVICTQHSHKAAQLVTTLPQAPVMFAQNVKLAIIVLMGYHVLFQQQRIQH